MNGDPRPHYRRQRRGGSPCDGPGSGRGWRKDNPRDDESSLSAHTAARALVAVGAYVAQDLRDRDGVMRPPLRRAALRLVTSRHAAIRRLGDAYLRGDPATREELDVRQRAAQPLLLPPGQPRHEPGTPRSQTTPEFPIAPV